MESSNANGVPVVVFTQPITTGTAAAGAHPYAAGRKALAKQLTILGSLQIVFGSLLILLQIVCVILSTAYYHYGPTIIGYGIWTGTFFVITGSFGCAAGRRNNRGFMITFSVMSILSATVNTVIVSLAGVSLVILNEDLDYNRGYARQYSETLERVYIASIALESLMIILALAEVIVAIWSSVVCCKMGACCCDCGGACCCPPDPASSQVIWAQPPPMDIAQQQQHQQQPMLVYAAVAPNSPANDVFQGHKQQKSFQYQQLVSDPNTPTDNEFGDRARLCA